MIFADDGSRIHFHIPNAEDGFRISIAEGLQELELRYEVMTDIGEIAVGIDNGFRQQGCCGYFLAGNGIQLLPEVADGFFPDGEPGSILVTAVGNQQGLAEGQSVMKIEFGNASTGTLADTVFQTDKDSGADNTDRQVVRQRSRSHRDASPPMRRQGTGIDRESGSTEYRG